MRGAAEAAEWVAARRLQRDSGAIPAQTGDRAEEGGEYAEQRPGWARGPDLVGDRGAHHGVTAKDVRWLGTGLLLLGALLGCVLLLLAYEGFLIYQLAAGPGLAFSVSLSPLTFW